MTDNLLSIHIDIMVAQTVQLSLKTLLFRQDVLQDHPVYDAGHLQA